GNSAIQPLPAGQEPASTFASREAGIALLQNQVTPGGEKPEMVRAQASLQEQSQSAQGPPTEGRQKLARAETDAAGKSKFETFSSKLAGKSLALASNEKQAGETSNRSLSAALADKDAKLQEDLGVAKSEKPAPEPLPEIQARDN